MTQAEFTVKMRLVRETKGAALYQEVNDAGHDVPQDQGRLNTMYVRKIAFVEVPSAITVKVGYDQK